jgi:hypothetical protein
VAFLIRKSSCEDSIFTHIIWEVRGEKMRARSSSHSSNALGTAKCAARHESIGQDHEEQPTVCAFAPRGQQNVIQFLKLVSCFWE